MKRQTMSDDAATVLSGALDGFALSEDELEFLREESPSGLTIFTRNIDQNNLAGLKELTSAIQSCRHEGEPPMLISIDQEGGRVARLKDPFPNLGPALKIADGKTSQDAIDAISQYGREVGIQLKNLGINVNFAPVLDVLANDENDSIGDRAFGRDAGTVTMRAGAFISGMKSTGIIGCGKHFPGQGDGRADTHFGTAVISKTLDELERSDMFPFKSLMPMLPMIMISHAVYPELDHKEASCSRRIIQEILRKKMGFQGVVVSDDMTMGAMPKDDEEWTQAIIESIFAGTDLVLICKGLDRWKLASDALRREAYRNSHFARRLSDSARRVHKLRESLV